MRTVPGPPALVVGAAVVRHGRVLATRRAYPPEARGRWELPGGKVEPGEAPGDAVVREVREELGCEVRVTGRLAGEQPVGDRLVLRVLLGEVGDGEPVPHEHDALRWLGPEELDDVRSSPSCARSCTTGTRSRAATSAVRSGSAGPSAAAPARGPLRCTGCSGTCAPRGCAPFRG